MSGRPPPTYLCVFIYSTHQLISSTAVCFPLHESGVVDLPYLFVGTYIAVHPSAASEHHVDCKRHYGHREKGKSDEQAIPDGTGAVTLLLFSG